MKTVTGIVIAIFAAMALLSFVVMDMPAGSGGMSGCLATKIHNGICPPETSAVDAAAFHTSAFGAFSLALIVSLASVFLFAAAYFLASRMAPLILTAQLQKAVSSAPQDFPASRKHLRATALFERSPTE